MKCKIPAPDFEVLRSTLSGEYANRIPKAEIDIAKEVKEGFLGRKVQTCADDVEFWFKAGYDYVLYPLEIDFANATFTHRRDDGTPLPQISSLEQAQKFHWPNPDDFDPSGLNEVAGCLPAGMKIIPRLGGLFYFPSVLLGFENLCITMLTEPDYATYIFNQVGNIVTGLTEKLVAHPAVGAIWLSSDIAFGTSLMAGPNELKKYVLPWVEKVCRITHNADKPVIFHSDGDLTKIIPDLIQAGIDALHPIEPQAMDIRSLRNKYGKKLSLIGNVDVDKLITADRNEILQEVEKLQTFFGKQGGYVLSSGNSIPKEVPLENFKALIGKIE